MSSRRKKVGEIGKEGGARDVSLLNDLHILTPWPESARELCRF
jgi:hypothetical protein